MGTFHASQQNTVVKSGATRNINELGAEEKNPQKT